jgi:PAS domain S-box-containing protein
MMNPSDDVDHIPELARLKEISERLLSPEVQQKVNDEVPIALVVADAEGRVVLFNRQAELLFGYSRVEVFGKPVEIFVPEARRGSHVQHRSRYTNDPQVRPMGRDLDLEARHKNGSTFPVAVMLAPLVTTEGIFTMAAIRRKDS